MQIRVNKILFLLVFACVLGTSKVDAQNSARNESGVATPFLLIAPDARALSLGGAGVASSSDVYSQYWNAAKYPFTTSSSAFAMSVTPWFHGFSTNTFLTSAVAYFKLSPSNVVASSVRYYHGGDYAPDEYAFDASFSHAFNDRFAVGATVRFIASDFRDFTASSYSYVGKSGAVDLSAFYKVPIALPSWRGNMGFGVVLSNWGSKMNYGSEDLVALPLNLRVGVSPKIQIDTINSIALQVDVNKLLVSTDNKARLSLGIEYAYKNMFFGRAGYYASNSQYSNLDYWSLGIGVRLNHFTVDLSNLLPLSSNTSLTNTISFSVGYLL